MDEKSSNHARTQRTVSPKVQKLESLVLQSMKKHVLEETTRTRGSSGGQDEISGLGSRSPSKLETRLTELEMFVEVTKSKIISFLSKR